MIVAMSKTPTEGSRERCPARGVPPQQLGDPAAAGVLLGPLEEQLAASAEEAGQLWERLLSEPTDADRVFVVDDGALEVRAGVIVAQALHHGNAHREQICAT